MPGSPAATKRPADRLTLILLYWFLKRIDYGRSRSITGRDTSYNKQAYAAPDRRDRHGAGEDMNVAVLHANRLYYFYETARLGSFSKAEEHLDVAQPALSRQVQLLEKELGAVLLERHARGVSLTENGRLVYDRAAQIFGLMSDIRQSLDAVRDQAAGPVCLGVPPIFPTNFTCELVARMRARHPLVFLQITEGPTGLVRDWVESGYVDIGIISQSENSKGLVEERLLTEELFLVGVPGSAAMKSQQVDVADLAELPMVLPRSPSGTRRLMDRLAARRGATLTPVIEIDSLTLIKDVIKSQGTPRSPLYSILPMTSCYLDLKEGSLAMVPLHPKLTRTLVQATREDVPLTLAARVVGREIAALLKESVAKQTPAKDRA
jgi:LysR family nitrogen assimilation transcriptional regulator